MRPVRLAPWVWGEVIFNNAIRLSHRKSLLRIVIRVLTRPTPVLAASLPAWSRPRGKLRYLHRFLLRLWPGVRALWPGGCGAIGFAQRAFLHRSYLPWLRPWLWLFQSRPRQRSAPP